MKKDILVVEDDPDTADIVTLTLIVEGYSVRNAFDGAEALRAIARERPAVVLLDMNIPTISGFEVARELRRKYGAILPIVAVTAAQHLQGQLHDLGIEDVLIKPFEIPYFLRIVARHFRHSSELETASP